MISVAAGKSETIRITFYCMQFPHEYENRKRKPKSEFGISKLANCRRVMPYKTPTACEISRTTMVREIKIWTIARIFAQRASKGESVGPKVELCVNATNR